MQNLKLNGLENPTEEEYKTIIYVLLNRIADIHILASLGGDDEDNIETLIKITELTSDILDEAKKDYTEGKYPIQVT